MASLDDVLEDEVWFQYDDTGTDMMIDLATCSKYGYDKQSSTSSSINLQDEDEEQTAIGTVTVTREEALTAAGGLVDTIGQPEVDQSKLAAKVRVWLTVPRFIVLPTEFKNRVGIFCQSYLREFYNEELRAYQNTDDALEYQYIDEELASRPIFKDPGAAEAADKPPCLAAHRDACVVTQSHPAGNSRVQRSLRISPGEHRGPGGFSCAA